MTCAPKLVAYAIPGIPLIKADDDIIAIIIERADAAGIELGAGDTLVISSKIVSKSLGRLVALAGVEPSAQAHALAAETGKDPRLVELILGESRRVSRKRFGVLVPASVGLVSANAGVDQSNIEAGDDMALLLPADPDGAAREYRKSIRERLGINVAVIISDTHGRPFRVGNVGVAIGAAGLPTVKDPNDQQSQRKGHLRSDRLGAHLLRQAERACGGIPSGLDLGPHGCRPI